MKIFVLATLLIHLSTTSVAQWPFLSTPNVQVTSSVSTSGDLKDYWANTDGSGGSFTFFTDDRADVSGGNESIYCQRIDKNGAVKFAANGVTISAISTADQDRPNSTEDGFGNGIVLWEDDRSGNDDIYAQKIDSNGVVQWTTNGVVICNATGDQKRAWVVPDDSSGAIIAWEDDRGADLNIYAQRIDSDGSVKWMANGVVICNATNDQKRLHMVEDGAGGAIITWEDRRSGRDVYAQRINAQGVVQWTANGVVVSNATDDQDRPQVTTDGLNGGIISWTDQRSGTEDIYAQRVNSSGIVQWTANGVVISNATDVQDRSQITSDQSNGAVVVWEDERSGTTIDIYAQRINGSGVVQWTANGVVVSDAADDQARPNISEGSFGKTLIVWEDARNAGTEDIYIQILTLNGDTLVDANGLAVCTSADAQTRPFIFRNADTDWIVTWKDDRNSGSGQTDLFAQGINPTIIPALPIELLYFKAKVINKITNLSWSTASEINNDFFTIYRSTDLNEWEKLIELPGAGNSTQILIYKWFDESPLNGTSYYRLKQTDFNGKFSYSDIEVINFEDELNDKIYPLPTSDYIYLSLVEKAISVKIFNSNGKLEHSESNINSHVLKIDVSDFIDGVYIITVNSNSSSKSFKFIVDK